MLLQMQLKKLLQSRILRKHSAKMLLEYEKIILKIRSYKNGLRFYNEEYVNKKTLL